MKRICLAVLLLPLSAWAWDGYDYESGTSVEIDKGNLVRRGKEIEFYDYNAGEYRTGEIESIRRSGRSVEVEVLDNETGEIRTFDMDGR
jgi:hypothetical protein